MNRYDMARALPCPRCGAERNEPCTYLPVPDVHWPRGNALERHKALQARVGSPTKTPHNERMNALRESELKAFRAQTVIRRKKQRPAVVRPSPEIIAVKEFDRQEFEDMRTWLRDHVKILIGASE